MSNAESVQAMLQNNTQYTIKYQSVTVEFGRYYNKNTTIAPNSTGQIFYASAVTITSGCVGAVIYNFVDQHGNTQIVTLTYSDPFEGANSFTVAVPNGMTGSVPAPQGNQVLVTYTIGGSIP